MGGERVIIAVRGPRDELVSALSGLPHVGGVEPAEEDDDGYVRIALASDESAALVDGVFDLVSARGWRLRELRRETASLEDIFLRLTTGEERRTDGQ